MLLSKPSMLNLNLQCLPPTTCYCREASTTRLLQRYSFRLAPTENFIQKTLLFWNMTLECLIVLGTSRSTILIDDQ